MLKTLLMALVMAATATTATAQDVSKSPSGAKVTILEPANGATVSSPLTVKFGLAGMEVSPAGTAKENAGHHHLIIDKTLADPKAAIPVDDNHKHFGKGQTETTVELKPGEHTLQLILADHNHIPHDPVVQSEVIKVTVK
ncbi:MAG: DUF4399 domain-containing protein [Hyphomicrobiaceae bacterium]